MIDPERVEQLIAYLGDDGHYEAIDLIRAQAARIAELEGYIAPRVVMHPRSRGWALLEKARPWTADVKAAAEEARMNLYRYVGSR